MPLREELLKNHDKIESYLMTSQGLTIAMLDAGLHIMDCNLGFMRLFQPRQKPVSISLSEFLDVEAVDVKRGGTFKLSFSRTMKKDGILDCTVIGVESGYLLFCERSVLTESKTIEGISLLNNELIALQRESVKKNTHLEKLERELANRIVELESILSRVKQLEGIIPICMYCKKIRDDQEIWSQLEEYISKHSEAEFSHGICPACLETRFPVDE